jgi:carbamoylphosphate synthase large subunit
MSHYEHTVLLGSGGTGTAFAAICALRRVWGASVRIVAIDVNPAHLCTSSILADIYQQVPSFSDSDFPETLRKILLKYNVDSYLPLFPTEIKLAAELVEREPECLAYSRLVPSLTTASLCNDKARLSNFLQAAGIPVPATGVISAPVENDHYFVKPRSSNGSIGAMHVSREELAVMSETEKGNLVIQEVCVGPETTVDVFASSSSSVVQAVCRERLETKSGVSVKCRVFIDPDATHLAAQIAGSLKLCGSFCFQTMVNGSGDVVVTDVNPRPGAATAMSVATGNDFFAATFANAWDLDCGGFFRYFENDIYVTRQYSEFVMTGDLAK